MNTFKIYYDDDSEQVTNANGTLEQFTKYLMQDGGRDVQENPVTGKETVRYIDQVGQMVWHVFTDHSDGFYFTEGEGLKAYDRLVNEGRANIRLYWEVTSESGDTIEEDHIKGQGEFPL